MEFQTKANPKNDLVLLLFTLTYRHQVSMYLYMIWAVIGNQMLFRARNIFRICHIQPTTSMYYLFSIYLRVQGKICH